MNERKRMYSDGRPYYSLNAWLKDTFGRKIYKLALDGGMTCPNRDGTLGTGGCIFCSHGGSGDFAEPRHTSVTEQINAAKASVHRKMKETETQSEEGRYIAYFQSYTNTYAPVSYLRPLFTEAIRHPEIAALSIGTRPDCMPDEVISLLKELNTIKPVWVELGLQTIHEETAKIIRRGYPLPVFSDTVRQLKSAGLTVIVHVILGLPGESREDMLATVHWLASFSPAIDGIKLQMLHILNQESSLMEIVKLIGSDVLPDDQKLILEIARVIRLGFLQQNAFHKDDTCVPLKKQFRMMETILYLYGKCRALISMGMPMSVLKEEKIFERIIAMKYDVPNDKPELFDAYKKQIDDFYQAVMERNA